HVLLRFNNQRTDLQHPLPYLDVALTSLKTLRPSSPHGFLLSRVVLILFIGDDFFELSQHLHSHYDAIGTVVTLSNKGTELRIQPFSGLFNMSRCILKLIAM